MLKLIIIISFFLSAIIINVEAQETDHNPGFQMVMMNNPAFTGSEGASVLRMSYLNYIPGNNYQLHSVFVSYDSYFQSLHGGAGIYLSDDYSGGIVNDLRGGLSYSYFLQAGKDLFINAGLSASFYNRGFNFGNAVLPDQIDPLGGAGSVSSETLISEGRTVFDVAAGFLMITGPFFSGFSVSHLAEPDISLGGLSNEKLNRKLDIHMGYDVLLSTEHNLKLTPLGFFGMQGGEISAALGTVFASKYLSVNGLALTENKKNLDLQTGFAINSGKLSFYYNYRMNLKSGNNMLPVTLMHMAGVVISLNNVDKRNTIKTINFPKL